MFKLKNDLFKMKKESNYDMLHWALFIAVAGTITVKILEVTSQKSFEIFAYNPSVAQYSTFVQLFS